MFAIAPWTERVGDAAKFISQEVGALIRDGRRDGVGIGSGVDHRGTGDCRHRTNSLWPLWCFILSFVSVFVCKTQIG